MAEEWEWIIKLKKPAKAGFKIKSSGEVGAWFKHRCYDKKEKGEGIPH